MAREIMYNNFEISLVIFMPNITTNNAIIYTNSSYKFSTSTIGFYSGIKNFYTHLLDFTSLNFKTF